MDSQRHEPLKDRLATIIQRGHVEQRTSEEVAEMVMLECYADSRNNPKDWFPSARQAAIKILNEAGGPIHIQDLFRLIKERGADIKDVSVLSSILSRDGETFQSVQPRGHWLLVNRDPRSQI